MKHMTKLLSASLILAVLVCMALPASAAFSLSAYAPFIGDTYMGTAPDEIGLLVSTVSVGQNPDNAYLRITREYQSNNSVIANTSRESSRGSTYYKYAGILPVVIDMPLTRTYICYEVRGGSTYDACVKYDVYYH